MRYLLIGIFVLASATSFAQADFLILKKNRKVVKKFYPGNEFIFSSYEGNFSGKIRDIARDSVFMVYYDIQRIPLMNGGVIIDTARTYYFAVPYTSITELGEKRTGFNWNASGAALLGGGTLLTAAGLASWVFSEKNTRYYASPELVGAAAALAVVGYFLARTGGKTMKLGKKYKLEYIKLKDD